MKKNKTRPSSVIQQLGIEASYLSTQEANSFQNKSKKNLFDILHIVKPVDIEPQKEQMIPTITSYPKLVVFTDGACSSNGTARARAGYGVVWPNNRSLDTSKRLMGSDQTNNRAEFMALIEAQRTADGIDPTQQMPLYVYTDSELLVNSITKWLAGWKKNGWKKSNKKPVLNQDLLQQIDSNPRPLIFKHVRAHTGRKDWESIYNEEADRLAREGLHK